MVDFQCRTLADGGGVVIFNFRTLADRGEWIVDGKILANLSDKIGNFFLFWPTLRHMSSFAVIEISSRGPIPYWSCLISDCVLDAG